MHLLGGSMNFERRRWCLSAGFMLVDYPCLRRSCILIISSSGLKTFVTANNEERGLHTCPAKRHVFPLAAFMSCGARGQLQIVSCLK